MILPRSRLMESLRRGCSQAYSALPPRERRALPGLAVFLGGMMAWQLLWLPLARERDRSEAHYRRSVTALRWMQAHAHEAGTVTAKEAAAEGALLGVVTGSAAPFGITVNRAEPAQDGSLHVTLDHAVFPRLASWLAGLEREHGVRASQAVLEREDASPGHVRATLTFRSAGLPHIP